MSQLDDYDRAILKELQINAHISHQDLADKVNLSKLAPPSAAAP